MLSSLFCSAVFASAWIQTARACTYFEVPDGHGKKISARTMEYFGAGPTDWQLAVHPEGERYQTTLTSGLIHKKKVKYGHVSIDADLPKWSGLNIAVDGLNTVGLSISANIYHGMQVASVETAAKATDDLLCFAFFPRWVLSSFASTKELSAALDDIIVTGCLGVSELAGLHWAVSDKDGNSVVIEYDGETGLKGKPHIYENKVGVMTNDPSYPWMVTNLNSYSFLSPEKLSDKRNKAIMMDTGFDEPTNEEVPDSVSAGYNLKGLPGDSTPPSRFTRVFYLREYSMLNAPPDGNTCILALTQALFNNICIPRGTEGRGPVEFTQWAAIKAPSMGAKGTYIVRSYVDMQWRYIDLSEAGLGVGSPSLRTRVETGLFNMASGISTLKPYSWSLAEQGDDGSNETTDPEHERRLSSTPCTASPGLERSSGFSCKLKSFQYPARSYNISLEMVLSIAIGTLFSCTLGACGGYWLGRRGKEGFEPVSQAA